MTNSPDPAKTKRGGVLGNVIGFIVAIALIAGVALVVYYYIDDQSPGEELLQRDATQWPELSDDQQTLALHAYWENLEADRASENPQEDPGLVDRIEEEIADAGEEFFEVIGTNMVDETLEENQTKAAENDWDVRKLMNKTFEPYDDDAETDEDADAEATADADQPETE